MIKETNNMENKFFTVGQLIEMLKNLPQDLPVEMSMNGEYSCDVTKEMIGVYHGALLIDDQGHDWHD